MKRLPLLALFFLVLCFPSCKESQQNNDVVTTNNQDVYDFHIQYSYQGVQMDDSDWRLKRVDSCNLYVFLEGWFLNDTVYIDDGKHVIADNLIVTTDPSIEVAADFVVENIAEIDHLTLKVNSSPKISFEIARKDFFIIGIRKHEKEISVVFYKEAPIYE